MKHGNKIKKFGRVRKQRQALARTLALNFFEKEKITTTESKAKALRPFVEKIITGAKNNNLATKRQLANRLNKEAMKKLTSQIVPRFASRNGGYTRIVRLPRRTTDGAKMAILEFVET